MIRYCVTPLKSNYTLTRSVHIYLNYYNHTLTWKLFQEVFSALEVFFLHTVNHSFHQSPASLCSNITVWGWPILTTLLKNSISWAFHIFLNLLSFFPHRIISCLYSTVPFMYFVYNYSKIWVLWGQRQLSLVYCSIVGANKSAWLLAITHKYLAYFQNRLAVESRVGLDMENPSSGMSPRVQILPLSSLPSSVSSSYWSQDVCGRSKLHI